jgi:hypothetical protein
LVNGNSTLSYKVGLNITDCTIEYNVPFLPSSKHRAISNPSELYMDLIYICATLPQYASVVIKNTIFEPGEDVAVKEEGVLIDSRAHTLSNKHQEDHRVLGAYSRWVLLHFTNSSLEIINSSFSGVSAGSGRTGILLGQDNPDEIDFASLTSWSYGLLTVEGGITNITSTNFRYYFYFLFYQLYVFCLQVMYSQVQYF